MNASGAESFMKCFSLIFCITRHFDMRELKCIRTFRYALITYCILADAYVDGVPRIPAGIIKSEFLDVAGPSRCGSYRGMQPLSSLQNRLNQDYGAVSL